MPPTTPITTDGIRSIFILLAVAGNETTRNAISWGMKALTDNPEQRRIWWDHFGGVAKTAVEEIVRYASPVSVDAVLQGAHASIGEADRLRIERQGATAVGGRFASPQVERKAKRRRRRFCVVGGHLPARSVDRRSELRFVDVVRVDVEHVAAAAVVDAGRPCREQRLPERRDADLEHVPRPFRAQLRPQLLDQSVGRHHLAASQGQEGQQGAFLRGPGRHVAAVHNDLEWAEDPHSCAHPKDRSSPGRARIRLASAQTTSSGSAMRTV